MQYHIIFNPLLFQALIQNLTRTMNENTMRSIANEIDLHQNIGLAHNLVQTLSEQIDMSRNLDQNLTQNLVRNDGGNLSQSLMRTEVLSQNVSHELDLSHHINRTNVEEQILDEAKRAPVVVQCEPDAMLVQSVGQRLASHSVPVHESPRQALELGEHLLPMQFHIKSEQEDEGYFYDTVNPGFWKNVNGVPGWCFCNMFSQTDLFVSDSDCPNLPNLLTAAIITQKKPL